MSRSRAYIAGVLCLLPALAQQRFPSETITAEGIDIPGQILTKLTGLKIGDLVDDAAFQLAAQKLQQTGLFAEVGFRYTPGPKKAGYALILSLKDHPQRISALFDFPGKPEEPIWACVKQQLPWLKNPLPAAGTAQDYIAHLAESCMPGVAPVVASMETNIATRKMELVFQPRDLPHVSSLEFSGVQKVTTKAVQEALAAVATDSQFTERRFRSLLELNLRPFYENHGILNVRFGSITFTPLDAGHVSVSTAIEEGLIYKLGEVTIEGPDLPGDVAGAQAKFKRGQTAAWNQILKSIEDLEKPLRKTGYIQVRSTTARALHDADAALALTVRVEKGKQYFFQSLSLQGTPAGMEDRLRKMWKLPAESPMDEPYMIEYWKSILQLPEIKNLKVSTSMRPLPGNKVDVVVAIR